MPLAPKRRGRPPRNAVPAIDPIGRSSAAVAAAAAAAALPPGSDVIDHDAVEAETPKRHVIVLKIPTETADDGQPPPVPTATMPKRRGRPPKHPDHPREGPGPNVSEAITEELARVVSAGIPGRSSVGAKAEGAGRRSAATTVTARASTGLRSPRTRAWMIRTQRRPTLDDPSDAGYSGSESNGQHVSKAVPPADRATLPPRRRGRPSKDRGAEHGGRRLHRSSVRRRKREMDEDGRSEDSEPDTTPHHKGRPSPERGDVDHPTRKRIRPESGGLEEGGTDGTTTGVKRRRTRSSRKEPVDDSRSRTIPARRAAVAGRDTMRQHAEAYISAADGESSDVEVEKYLAAVRAGPADVRSMASADDAYAPTTHEAVDPLPPPKRRGRPPRDRPVQGQSISLRLSVARPSRGQTLETGEADVAVLSEPPPGSSAELSDGRRPVPAPVTKRAIRPTEKAVGAGGVTVRRTSTSNPPSGESEPERPTPTFPHSTSAPPGPGRVERSSKAIAGGPQHHRPSSPQREGTTSAIDTRELRRPQRARTTGMMDPIHPETASAHPPPRPEPSPPKSVAEGSGVAEEAELAAIFAGPISPTGHVDPMAPDPAVTGQPGRRRREDVDPPTPNLPPPSRRVGSGAPASSLARPNDPTPTTNPPVKRRGRPPRNPDHLTSSVASGSSRVHSTLVHETVTGVGLPSASDAIVPKRRGRPSRNGDVATTPSSVGRGSPPSMTPSLGPSNLPVTPDPTVPKRRGRPPRKDSTALLASTMPRTSKPEDPTPHRAELQDHGEKADVGFEGASKIPARSEKRAAAMRAWWAGRKAVEAAAALAETAAPPDHPTEQEETESAEKGTEERSGTGSNPRSKTISESERERQPHKPFRWKLYIGSERKAKLEAEAALLNGPGDAAAAADEPGQTPNEPQSESKSRGGEEEEEEEELEKAGQRHSGVPDTGLIQAAERRFDTRSEEWVDEHRLERNALSQGEDHRTRELREESENKQVEGLGSHMKGIPDNGPEGRLDDERASDMQLDGKPEGDSRNPFDFRTDGDLDRHTLNRSNPDVESGRQEQSDRESERARKNRKLERLNYSQSPGQSAINELSEGQAPAAMASVTGEEAPLDVSLLRDIVEETAKVPQAEGDKGTEEKQEELNRRIDGIMAEFGQKDVIMHFARRLSSR